MIAFIMRANMRCLGTFKSETFQKAPSDWILLMLPRYFAQRYSIFSLYDYGVYMTDDAWFGVTPEPVAK